VIVKVETIQERRSRGDAKIAEVPVLLRVPRVSA
jgi:hypothetical protein